MSQDHEDYPVDEVARAWLVKMRGDNAAALREEFDAWLSASPEHQAAYDRITRKLAGSAVLKSSSRHGAAHAEQRSARRPAARRWLSAGALLAAAAVVFLAFGAGGASLPGRFGDGPLAARAAEPLVTGRGEIRSFRFADGSTAVLDTDSRVEVSLAKAARHLRLAKGRVRLSVTGKGQPLRIEAGDRLVTAEDAAFDVGIDEDGEIRVQLLRGSASIQSADTPETGARRPETLPFGRSVTYGPDGKTRPAEGSPSQEDPPEWPTGWAEYRSIRLDHLIAQANRYAEQPIVIDDAETARLEASGRFRISRPEIVAERLAQLFDLQIARHGNSIHLRRR